MDGDLPPVRRARDEPVAQGGPSPVLRAALRVLRGAPAGVAAGRMPSLATGLAVLGVGAVVAVGAAVVGTGLVQATGEG